MHTKRIAYTVTFVTERPLTEDEAKTMWSAFNDFKKLAPSKYQISQTSITPDHVSITAVGEYAAVRVLDLLGGDVVRGLTSISAYSVEELDE